ncbi:MAG: hypothetical protein QOJ99_4805, partial [Bryobacterales bacterium]|nr:hypothetical protein [Bryobacterales bacterium]
ASKPAAESRMWMIEGFAGGIQPWWHHIGAYHEDRRMYRTAEPLMKWYEENEQYLLNRKPLATVGIAWSQRNTDYYGRERAAELVDAPYRGFTAAMLRARVGYVPIHIDNLERDGAGLKVLVLPNLGVMSDAQCAAVRKFVEGGGSLIATGTTSLYDDAGLPRADFGLADLFGAHFTGKAGADRMAAVQTQHTYLRLSPELRAGVWGPKAAGEPPAAGKRHPALKGFEETDIIPFGGVLSALRLDPGVEVPLTWIPPFPVYPPETSWMRQPKTDIPGLVLHGRVAFLPADIDRRYGREKLPDHGDLLGNLVKWAAGDSIPVRLEGSGIFDCSAYTQTGRTVVHLVNLTVTGRMPIDELVPVGPLRLSVRTSTSGKAKTARLLVGNRTIGVGARDGWTTAAITSVLDHEVVVFE